jgi:hypothetical protein
MRVLVLALDPVFFQKRSACMRVKILLFDNGVRIERGN